MFIDDADTSIRMNSEVYKDNATNLTEQHFTVRVDNHPKHTEKATP